MKFNPIPHAIFESARLGFTQILPHFSVSCSASLYFSLAQTSYTLDKIAHQSEFFGLLSGWVKIDQILHVIFETMSQFFYKLCITLQCHER